MGLNHNNLRVFVSSKMGELAAERQVVKAALQELLVEAFVFEEDAGARETTIERAFLDELILSDLYVGLFWREYGAYTIQEYVEAEKRQIPRLVFEKRLELAGRDARLHSFLQDKSNVHTGITMRWFESATDLRQKVKEDVARWQAYSIRKEREVAVPPEKLPCLCNRTQQEQELKKAVVPHLQQQQRRPLLVVMPGNEQEGHRHFIDRIEAQSVLESLSLAAVQGSSKLLRIHEPLDANQPPDAFTARLRMVLAQELRVADSGNDQFLVDYARRWQLKALIVVLSVLSSELPHNGNPLSMTCEYLVAFPDLPAGFLLSFMVCLQYAGEPEGRAASWLPWLWRRVLHAFTESADDALQSELQRCSALYTQDPRLRFVVLPTLHSPTPADVVRWCDDEQVKPHVGFVPRREIHKLFVGRDSLPMEELYEKLLDLVEQAP